MARRRRSRSKEDRDLDRLIEKINKTAKPSRKQERRQTSRVKAYDVTETDVSGNTGDGGWKLRDKVAPDPYLVGIAAKSAGKDPVAAIEAINKKPKLSKLGKRLSRAITARAEREREYVAAVEAKKAAPIRREIPRPQQLTELMAPPLPPRKKGSKPNIVSLVYAFRAFQQFSHAFTRRRISDPAAREVYYQEMKAAFRKAMEDCDMADLFDWSDF